VAQQENIEIRESLERLSRRDLRHGHVERRQLDAIRELILSAPRPGKSKTSASTGKAVR
jgi:hypothetical protein